MQLLFWGVYALKANVAHAINQPFEGKWLATWLYKKTLALQIQREGERRWLDQNGGTLLLATLEDQMQTACSECKEAGAQGESATPSPAKTPPPFGVLTIR